MPKAFDRLREKERLLLERAHSATYSDPPEGAGLRLHLFFPEGHGTSGRHPVLVFFHGGAWDRGNVVQFAPHALHFASRGAVCVLAEYRTLASHPSSTAIEAHADCRAALDFLHRQAEAFHLDPSKFVALGTGAGANLAGSAALGVPLSELMASNDGSDPESCTQAALAAAVLFSATIEVDRARPGYDRFPDPAAARASSLGHQVRSGAPPMLLLHGSVDRLVPLDEVSAFVEQMRRRKNPVELSAFEGRDRDFFNFATDPVSYEASLLIVGDFLERHGLLGECAGADPCQILSWRENDY